MIREHLETYRLRLALRAERVFSLLFKGVEAPLQTRYIKKAIFNVLDTSLQKGNIPIRQTIA